MSTSAAASSARASGALVVATAKAAAHTERTAPVRRSIERAAVRLRRTVWLARIG
jgi:hypothetical protein